MSSSPGERDAKTAARTQSELFNRYREVGIPLLGSTLDQTNAQLRLGLEGPAYIQRAYGEARTGAAEGAAQVGQNLRSRVTVGGATGQLLRGVAQAEGVAGKALVDETSAIRSSQAMNQIQQRNNLLNVLSGQGAQATQLSAGFGRLGLAGIGQELQQGNPTYEAILGLGSAGSAAYLQYLQNRPLQLPAATNTFVNLYGGR